MMTTVAEIVDAADQLSTDEQQTLVEILNCRLAERNRERLICDVADARAELVCGHARTVCVTEIMAEVDVDE